MKLERVTSNEKRWYDDACGTALAMELVGERRSLLVVRELMFGAPVGFRFGAETFRAVVGADGIGIRRQAPRVMSSSIPTR